MYVFRENFPLILGHKVSSKSILRDTQKAQKANIHQRQEDTMQLQEYKNTDSYVQELRIKAMLTFGPNTCLSSMAATIQHLMA